MDLISKKILMMMMVMLRTYSILLLKGKDSIIGPQVDVEIFNWRYETDEETDDDTDADTCPPVDLAFERITPGLSASGPLKLKEVKNAYQVCALQWHSDCHQSTSKALENELAKEMTCIKK
ncbi:hypothetical protein M5K25_008579 [Dendrobium thyrsiflorum]|uniref:Uncharacterized protein n=1 Tax=Dendrobium thyrsiflorum TaxID=117978 RepID=A0ABD0VFQ9_DENTH